MNYDPLSAPVATVLPSRILATASSADTTLPGIGKKHGGKLYIRASSCGKRSGMRGLCLWIHSISKDLYVSCITPYHCIINHVHTHKYISTYLRIWISIYIYMSVHALNIWYIYIYVCVYIYMCIYIIIYICVYTYYIHMLWYFHQKKCIHNPCMDSWRRPTPGLVRPPHSDLGCWWWLASRPQITAGYCTLNIG